MILTLLSTRVVHNYTKWTYDGIDISIYYGQKRKK